MKGFSVGSALKTGWKGYRKNWLFLSFITLIVLIVPNLPLLAIFLFFKPSAYTVTLLSILQILLAVYLTLGYYKTAWRVGGGEPLRHSDPFSCFPPILNYILAQVFLAAILFLWAFINYIPYLLEMVFILGFKKVSLKMAIGTFSDGIFFFNPYHTVLDWMDSGGGWQPRALLLVFHSAIYFVVFSWICLTFWLVPFVMVERLTGPIDALRKSAFIVHGARWDLLALLATLVIIIWITFTLTFIFGFLVVLPIAYLAQGFAYRRLSQTTPEEELYG